ARPALHQSTSFEVGRGRRFSGLVIQFVRGMSNTNRGLGPRPPPQSGLYPCERPHFSSWGPPPRLSSRSAAPPRRLRRPPVRRQGHRHDGRRLNSRPPRSRLTPVRPRPAVEAEASPADAADVAAAQTRPPRQAAPIRSRTTA